MRIILSAREGAKSLEADVQKNQLVVAIKAHIQANVSSFAGKLITLHCEKSGAELLDDRYIGDYKTIQSQSVIHFSLPLTQPYAEVHYAQIKLKLEEGLERKPLKAFFDPERKDNDWVEAWNKGDEYLNYPPIDVYRSVAESKLNIKSVSQDKAAFREKMEDYMKRMLDSGRSFHSLYVCRVKGLTFHCFHKFEGKWSGSAVHYTEGGVSSHSCSSRLVYDSKRKSWIEEQRYTLPNGLTNTKVFQYMPQADGICKASCDDPRLMENVTLKLREEENASLLLTGVDLKTGNTVLTESIVLTSGLKSEERTRTITRLTSNGNFLGVVVCREKRVIDSDSGALAASLF